MYLLARRRVCILESLSEGRVGTISRRLENASFKLFVRCRSRTFARNKKQLELRALVTKNVLYEKKKC